MNGIFQFLGRSLVGVRQAGGVGFQIDLYLALGNDVAGLRIVFEVRTVDLVKASGIPPVESDGHAVQLGEAAFLELDGLAGLDLKQSSRSVRSAVGEAVRTLLNSGADFLWHLLECVLHPVPGIEIFAGYDRDSGDGGHDKPAAKMEDGKSHLGTVYFRGLARVRFGHSLGGGSVFG